MTTKKERQYAAFETLITCCANNEENIHALISEVHQQIEKERDVLEELLEYTAVNEVNFFVNVGISDGWFPNNWIESETKNVLKSQFPELEIELPKAKNYEDTKFLTGNILNDFDSALREHQLQFSYIENEHYDFVCVIHAIVDREKLFEALKSIGYDFKEI